MEDERTTKEEKPTFASTNAIYYTKDFESLFLAIQANMLVSCAILVSLSYNTTAAKK